MKFKGKDIELKPIETLETKQNGGNFYTTNLVSFAEEVFAELDATTTDGEPENNALDKLKILDNLIKTRDWILQSIVESMYKREDGQDYSNTFRNILDEVMSGNIEARKKLLEILKQHDELSVSNYQEMQQNLEDINSDFLTQIEISLNELGEYDIEKVKAIVKGIQINFFSPIYDKGSRAFYKGDHDIFFRVDMGQFPEKFKATVFHEYLHAISIDFDKILTFGEDSGFVPGSMPQVIGVNARGFKTTRFAWLNEALTEYLALDMAYGGLPPNIESVYGQYISLLNALVEKKKIDSNLDINLLKKVYFRNLKIRKGNERSAIEDWKEFSREIDISYGPRFLVKLDLFIEKMGIDKALDVIGAWPAEEPNLEDLN